MRDQHHTAVIARNDLLPPLYIVEGLLSPPPLYRLEGFQPESLATLGASLGDGALSEVAHSLQVVRSR